MPHARLPDGKTIAYSMVVGRLHGHQLANRGHKEAVHMCLDMYHSFSLTYGTIKKEISDHCLGELLRSQF
jgi:hypothetical protein